MQCFVTFHYPGSLLYAMQSERLDLMSQAVAAVEAFEQQCAQWQHSQVRVMCLRP